MYQQMNYGQPQFGVMYGNRPMPKCTQPVTSEMEKLLKQNNDELDIRISNTDKIKNWCTHKEPGTGRLALVENADGTVTCRVCGERFHMVEDTEEQVQQTADHMIDILQTIKAMYLDAPEEFIKNYSQTLSMMRMVTNVYKRASNNFGVYEAYSGNLFNANPGYNTFAAANGILGSFNPLGYNPMPMNMGYGQPQAWPQAPQGYYPGYQQPGYAQQPQAWPQQPQQGGWAMPPQNGQQMGAPTVPYVDPNGQVMPGAPMGPTTMGGNPMMPGFNPLMNTGVPGANMTAPAPTGPAVQQPAAPATAEPTQNKQMTV